jgi:RND superfamily putative drug exporter
MNSGGFTARAPARSSLLHRFAGAVIRHARVVLVLWLVATAVLAVEGIGLENRLAAPELGGDVSVSRGQQLLVRDFGAQDDLVLMLRGPRGALDRKGPRVEQALDALPRTHVASPWRADGAAAELRPDPRTAVVVVNVDRAAGQDAAAALAPVRAAVARTVRPPLRADLTGSPVLGAAAAHAASHATGRGMLSALPIFLLVLVALLLTFRSVLALVPPLVGATTVAASRGLMELLSGSVELTSLAAGLAAMVAAALGVGYSLLVVVRFREERRGGADLPAAAQTAVATTGRAVALAGTALALSLLVAAQVLPGEIFDAAAAAIVVASLLSVVAAIVVVPALLALLDPPAESASPSHRPAGVEPHAARRGRPAGLAAAATVALLLAGTAAAFALDTGPSSAGSLPPGDAARVQFEAVERTLGPGWGSPFEIVMDGRDRPVTEPGRLQALAGFERAVAGDPGVATLLGLSRVERAARRLRGAPGQLDRLQHGLADGKRRLVRVGSGVGDAHVSAGQISAGLAGAAAGAASLDAATGSTQADADNLASELRASQPASQRLVAGLGQASDGGGRLARAADQARSGADALSRELTGVQATPAAMVDRTAELKGALTAGGGQLADARGRADGAGAQLVAAWSALRRMTAAKADPQYQAAIQAVQQASIAVTGVDPATGEPPDGGEQGIGDGVQDAAGELSLGLYVADRAAASGRDAQSGIDRLTRGAGQLAGGLDRLSSGGDRLVAGFSKLQNGSGQLSTGLGRLSRGADALTGGLGQARAGTGQLADGLGSGASNSRALVSGLGRIERGVRRQQGSAFGGQGDLSRLRQRTPGLLGSGYLMLAALDRADPRDRGQATLLVNVDRGGHAARMLVIPTTGLLSAATQRTRERLARRADALGRRTGSEVVVAGPAAALWDQDTAIHDRIPLLVLLLSALTALLLAVSTRSLVLPLVAAALNALVAGAALGVLALVGDALLGGPGYVETIAVAFTIATIFGLSIGYELFVLGRMREERERTGSARLAVANGLRRGAAPLGAWAAVTVAVFAAFATPSFASIRSFGVGIAAGTLAALLVCLVVLPAIMRLLGERSWWLPGWLERILSRRGRAAGRQAAA